MPDPPDKQGISYIGVPLLQCWLSLRAVPREYVGKDCDLDLLSDSVEEHFQTEGYQTRSSKVREGWIVQARKSGILRDVDQQVELRV